MPWFKTIQILHVNLSQRQQSQVSPAGARHGNAREAANTGAAKDAIPFKKKKDPISVSRDGSQTTGYKNARLPLPSRKKIQNLFKNKRRKSYNTKSKMI